VLEWCERGGEGGVLVGVDDCCEVYLSGFHERA
jgi:hypothetical protein